jgi:hypothetical protein
MLELTGTVPHPLTRVHALASTPPPLGAQLSHLPGQLKLTWHEDSKDERGPLDLEAWWNIKVDPYGPGVMDKLVDERATHSTTGAALPGVRVDIQARLHVKQADEPVVGYHDLAVWLAELLRKSPQTAGLTVDVVETSAPPLPSMGRTVTAQRTWYSTNHGQLYTAVYDAINCEVAVYEVYDDAEQSLSRELLASKLSGIKRWFASANQVKYRSANHRWEFCLPTDPETWREVVDHATRLHSIPARDQSAS